MRLSRFLRRTAIMVALGAAVLAACAGVLLAAFESSHDRHHARLRRLSTALIVGVAVVAAAGVAWAAF